MGGLAPHLRPWVLGKKTAVSTPKIDDFRGRLLKIRVFGPLASSSEGKGHLPRGNAEGASTSRNIPCVTQAGKRAYGPDSNREKLKIRPPAVRRPAGGPMQMPSRQESGRDPAPEAPGRPTDSQGGPSGGLPRPGSKNLKAYTFCRARPSGREEWSGRGAPCPVPAPGEGGGPPGGPRGLRQTKAKNLET